MYYLDTIEVPILKVCSVNVRVFTENVRNREPHRT